MGILVGITSDACGMDWTDWVLELKSCLKAKDFYELIELKPNITF